AGRLLPGIPNRMKRGEAYGTGIDPAPESQSGKILPYGLRLCKKPGGCPGHCPRCYCQGIAKGASGEQSHVPGNLVLPNFNQSKPFFCPQTEKYPEPGGSEALLPGGGLDWAGVAVRCHRPAAPQAENRDSS